MTAIEVLVDVLRGLPIKNVILSAVGVVVTVVAYLAYNIVRGERPLPGFTLASISGRSPKISWLFYGRQLLVESAAKYAGAFQVMTGTGPKIVLPNRFAEEIRSHPDMSLNKAFTKDFFTEYPGFEPLRQGLEDDTLMQETVRVKLTQSLTLVTDDLVDETIASLHDILGDDTGEWKTAVLKESVLDMISRLTSRVFLGINLCRNPRWLAIAKSYTVQAFIASHLLHMVPTLLRPLVFWLIPQCRACRRIYRDAHRLIDPEVDQRVTLVNEALERGEKPERRVDAIAWLHEVSRGRKVDYVAAQLSLSLAAIHTTSETTSQAILDVCEHPWVVEPLRREIIQVIGEHGWAKTSLSKLRLMDSFLRESQRFRPIATASMHRIMEREVVLSDGTVLPQNTRAVVVTDYDNPDVFPRPREYDPWRFSDLRAQPGQESAWQLVTTSSNNMLFGHGKHACPGRFFATNEMKVALCHMLLKYDWRFVPPATTRPDYMHFEQVISVPDKVKVQYRRRKEEVSLALK